MGFDGKNVATTDTNHATTGIEMRAIVQDSYGSAEVLRAAQIDRPEIAEHEVLLRSPGRPRMLRISAGASPVLPNQCGTFVSNAATSPGPSTMSWSPRTKRMCPDST